jgi:hypothetical protein
VTGERTSFECSVCRVVITRALTLLPNDHPICLEDRKPAIPEGYFAPVNFDDWAVSGTAAVVNLNDLVGTKHPPDVQRLNGCCGLDGLDGPNLICPNGHEVGTEKSDCWMPHAAVLLDKLIRVNERSSYPHYCPETFSGDPSAR